MEPQFSDFVEGWPLFRDATLTGVFAGATLGLVGVYIVLRRMVFLSAAVSQASGFGVVLAFYAQIHWSATTFGSPLLWASGITIISLFALWGSTDTNRRDATLGIIFLAGMAGSLALAGKVTQELHDVKTLLFGSAVAVMPEDFTHVLWLAVGMAVIHLWWSRGFIAVCLDSPGAKVRGLPVRLIEAVLLLSIGLTVGLTTKVIGALPVFAFSILPALAALQWVANPQRALILAALFGALAGAAGYVLSFLKDLPVGAAQTLVALAILLVSMIGAKLRLRIAT